MVRLLLACISCFFVASSQSSLSAAEPDPEPTDDRILFEGPLPAKVVTRRRIAGDEQEPFPPSRGGV